MPAASCLPLAIVGNDPAFRNCMVIVATTHDLVMQFADLRKTRLANGQVADRDVAAFVVYVYREIYTQLSERALAAMRMKVRG